jgi:predicted glycosyltransferase
MRATRMKNVLYVSGAIGIGHATRDLAIAHELRKSDPQVRIPWLADSSAVDAVRQACEEFLPESVGIRV